MGYSYTEGTGDNTTTSFTFSFVGPDNGYYQEDQIKVYVDGVPAIFDLTGPNQITLLEAPVEGSVILIAREPDITDTYTNFARGNNFGKDSINRAFQQMLYLNQRLQDGFKEEGYYEKQNLNVGGHKITNLEAGTDPLDAVNLEQLSIAATNIVSLKDRIILEEATSVLHLSFNINAALPNFIVFVDGVPLYDAFACDSEGVLVTTEETPYINLGAEYPIGADILVLSTMSSLTSSTYNVSFDTVDDMISTIIPKGFVVTTKGYYTTTDKGGGIYICVSGNTGDGYVNHNNGDNTLILQSGASIDVKQCGARGNGFTDDTAAIQAALDSGYSHIVISEGSYILTDTLLLPTSVDTVEGSGSSVIQTVNKAIWYKAGTLIGSPIYATKGASVGDSTISVASEDLSKFDVDDWYLIRSGDLTPNITAGSRVAMLRQITSVGLAVHLDAAIYRDMTLDVDGSLMQMKKVSFGDKVLFKGGTYKAIDQSNSVALFDFLLCHSPDFLNVTITHSGGSGIRLAHCINGSFVSSHVSDLLDDRDNGHFGYGVVLCGACRGFQFSSGSVNKVRHGITTSSVFSTTLGFKIATDLPTEILYDVQGRGEPEACHYGPVAVTNTTNAGLDTHEQGFGISITPNVNGCFDGVLIRCSDATIDGGQIINCRRTGVRTDIASSNPSPTVSIKLHINGTSIINTTDEGTGSQGLSLEGPGAIIYANNLNIRGYAFAGIYIDTDVVAHISGCIVDGIKPTANRRGVKVLSVGSDIINSIIINNYRGIEGDISYYHTTFDGNDTDIYGEDYPSLIKDHELPSIYHIPGRYYSSGCNGGVSTSSSLGSDVLRVSPFYVREAISIDRLGVDITYPGSSGDIRLNIYKDDGAGYPFHKVLNSDVVLAATSSGPTEAVVSATLLPGLYWFGAAIQGSPTTQPTLRTTVASSFSVGATSLTVACQATVGYALSGVTGDFPYEFTTKANAVGVAAKIAVRVV